MKKLLILLLVAPVLIKAQELKRYELGSTLVTFNIGVLGGENFFFHEKPPDEILNGLFVRYKLNRWSVRSLLSYYEYSYSYSPIPECVDCDAGAVNNKEFRIGGGMQYSLIRTKEWLYGFADVLYRNVFVNGVSNGGMTGKAISYNYTGHGTNSTLGMGAKFNVFKELVLSPELAYDIVTGTQQKTVTEINTGKIERFRSFDVNLSMIFRVHASVRF